MEMFWADTSDRKGVIPMVLLPVGVTVDTVKREKGNIQVEHAPEGVTVLSDSQITRLTGLTQGDLRLLAGNTNLNTTKAILNSGVSKHRINKNGVDYYFGLHGDSTSTKTGSMDIYYSLFTRPKGHGGAGYNRDTPWEYMITTRLPDGKQRVEGGLGVFTLKTTTNPPSYVHETYIGSQALTMGNIESINGYPVYSITTFSVSALSGSILNAKPVQDVPVEDTFLPSPRSPSGIQASSNSVLFFLRDRQGNVIPAIIISLLDYSVEETVTGEKKYTSLYDNRFGDLTIIPLENKKLTEVLSGLPGSEPPPPPKERFDIMKRFSPRIYTNGLGIYFLEKKEVQTFTSSLWEAGFKEAFIREVNGNPTESVVSFKYYYGLNDFVTEKAPKDVYLSIGNVVFDGTMIGGGSRIVCKTATSEFARFSFGEITIPRKFNNFLDMSPFTGVTLYIPYVGYVNLDATEVVGQTLEVLCHLNLITGAIQMFVYKKRGAEWVKIHTSSGDMGMDIPLNANAKEDILTKIVRSSPIPIPYKDALFPNSEYKVSTPYNSESGSLEEFNCYAIIKRPVPKAPAGYNDIVGRPDMRSGTMSSFKSKTNFVKVGGIKSGSVAIPEVVFAEIKELLEQGVYFK